MGDRELQEVTGVTRDNRGYKRLHGVTAGYEGLQRNRENLLSN